MSSISRLRELEAKEATDPGLSQEETAEMDGLRYGRHSEIMSLIPVPRCCEASQKYPAIAFAVDYEDDD